ncbi:NYN domain-containing protein [Mycena metata]|uniref:NYN domain-containing protein n=1 Tax=Mycena metata TaxID=1033252 RepID=A0AAD7NA26_9AGAR|nr:NYN domain-containing protein [Mycena metata]
MPAENCHASSQVSGYEIVSGIRNVAHRFGPVKYFKAYIELPEADTFRSLSLRSELQCSGVSLTDCPHNGRKNVADQMIMVDMLAYAIDHPTPATIILISGDRDFAYAVSILRLRRYDVVVISLPLPGAHISLRSQASVYLDWNVDVMGYPSSSSYPEGSPAAARSPTNSSQSTHARRPSYHLPTPDSPYSTSRAPAPDVKHVPVAAVPAESSTSASAKTTAPTLEPLTEHLPAQSTPQAEPEVICVPAPAYSAPSVPVPGPSVPVATRVAPTTPEPMLLSISDPTPAHIQPQSFTNSFPAMPAPSQSVGTNTAAPTPVPQSSQSSAANTITAAISPPIQSVGTNTVAPTPAPRPSQLAAGQTWLNTAPSSPALFSEDLVAAHIQRCMDMATDVPPIASPTPTPQAGPSSLPNMPPPSTIPARDVHAVPEARPAPRKSIPTPIIPPTPKVVPAIFKSLVASLEKQRAKGIPRPLRSIVSVDIMKDKQLYQRAGVQKFSQFAGLAEKAGIIKLGGTQASAWISLHPDLCK